MQPEITLSDYTLEKSIIANLLFYDNNKLLVELFKLIKHEYDVFTDKTFRNIYKAAIDLYENAHPVSLVTISRRLKELNLHTKILDEYLIELAMFPSVASDFLYRLSILYELYLKRKAKDIFYQGYVELSQNAGLDIFEFLENASSKLSGMKEVGGFVDYTSYLINPLQSEDEEQEATLRVISGGSKVDMFHLGDFSLLTGKQKSKKTIFCSLIAQAFATNSVIQDVLEPLINLRFVYFDTEQGKKYAIRTARRITSNGQYPIHYLNFRDLDPYDRRQQIEIYFTKNPDVKFGIIDGIVDLLYDFNDQKESAKLVNWLMNLTKKYSVHLLCVLHQNKGMGDRNARGHLGTMMSQKAEVVIGVERTDDKSESKVYCLDSRGKPFNDLFVSVDMNGNAFIRGEQTGFVDKF